jgi:dienelactone hydrolase
MAQVYSARDTRLDRPVAIKVVSEVFARRFEREGRTLAAINHPNICTLYAMDLGRTIDYLETRPDIDARRLAFYGLSAGASNGIRMAAVEPRVKLLVLSSGGVMRNEMAEVNSWNFAPRVHVPVLMLNGRDDFIFPIETNQKVLFRAFGTKQADKKHVLYDGGHRNLVTRPDLIGEILDWLDKYLGPVDLQRNE